MSGKIVFTKDAGASVASTISGGELYVEGNAGATAGIFGAGRNELSSRGQQKW